MSIGPNNPVSRGDVVLVRYPFSDQTGYKIRPSLVVQNDRNNARLDDTVVVSITSRTKYVATEPTQVLVDVATTEGKQSGLLHTSVVACENIATVDQSLIIRHIGHLPDILMKKVDSALKASLALP